MKTATFGESAPTATAFIGEPFGLLEAGQTRTATAVIGKPFGLLETGRHPERFNPYGVFLLSVWRPVASATSRLFSLLFAL